MNLSHHLRSLTGATENIPSTAFPTSVLSAATSDNYLNASATPTGGALDVLCNFRSDGCKKSTLSLYNYLPMQVW